MCYNRLNEVDNICISKVYFSSIIKLIKQNQNGFDTIL